MSSYLTYQYLETFSQEDWKAFKKFLSEKTKGTSNVIELINYLHRWSKNHPTKTFPEIKTIQLNQFSELDKKGLLNILSKANKKIEEFLIDQQLKQNSNLQDYLLNKALIHRQLTEIFERTLRKSKAIENDDRQLDSSLFAHLRNHLLFYSETDYKKSIGLELLNNSLDEIKNYVAILEKYYAITHSNIRLQAYSSTESGTLKLTTSPESREFVHQILNLLLDYPSISEDNYEKLHKYILDWKIETKHELYSVAMLFAIQFCMRQIRNRKLKFHPKQLDLYKHALKNNVFTEKGVISYRRFGNCIDCACKNGDTQYAEKILTKYIDKVTLEHRNHTKLMSRVQILLAPKVISQEILNKILRLLELEEKELNTYGFTTERNKLKNKNQIRDYTYVKPSWTTIDFKLRSRWYEIVCYYELREFEILDKKLEACKKFINRNTKLVNDPTQKATRNFIDIVKKMRLGKSKETLKQMYDSPDLLLVLQLWVKEKIDQLKT